MAFDGNNDGRLDRGEVPERFQGLFDRSDANKDGALTRDELKQSATASMQDDGGRGGRGRGGMMADPLMRALDTDRDGSLSETEIAAAADAITPLDINQDGQLSAEEFRPQPGRGRGGREGGRL
jgi:Ca2+-binding EF-hand superfamily protein